MLLFFIFMLTIISFLMYIYIKNRGNFDNPSNIPDFLIKQVQL